MPKTECPSCAMMVDSQHKECPICGARLQHHSPLTQWVAIGLALLFLFILIISKLI